MNKQRKKEKMANKTWQEVRAYPVTGDLCYLEFKVNVPCAGIQPEMLQVLDLLRAAAKALNIAKLRVTSCRYRDTHGNESHHYKGLALDIGSKEFDASTKSDLLDAFEDVLGDEFFVDLEGAGSAGEHFHIEYEPLQRPLEENDI